VVEALDRRDDEGPTHPCVFCRISHVLSLSISLALSLSLGSWRISQPEELLLTADDIPSERNSMQRNFPFSSKKKYARVWGEEKKNKTLPVAWLLESTTRWVASGAPGFTRPRYVPVASFNPDGTARSAAGFLKSSSIPWHHYSPRVVRHNGAAVRQRRRAAGRVTR